MTERLLRIEGGRLRIGTLRLSVSLAPHESALIAAELDRLYVAAEANQAPGCGCKAKLRQEVERERQTQLSICAHVEWHRGRDAALASFAARVDALPDPPTLDPDAPPVYVPPEGHYAPVRGEDVPDGWEGRYLTSRDQWLHAGACRQYPHMLFEVRRVPAPEPATEWVPLTKLVGRTIKGETEPVHRMDSPTGVVTARWRWRPFSTAIWQHFPDGTLNLDTAQVLVLAEGER